NLGQRLHPLNPLLGQPFDHLGIVNQRPEAVDLPVMLFGRIESHLHGALHPKTKTGILRNVDLHISPDSMWGPVQCSRCCALPMPPRPERSDWRSQILAESRYCLFTGSPKGLPFGVILCPHAPNARTGEARSSLTVD